MKKIFVFITAVLLSMGILALSAIAQSCYETPENQRDSVCRELLKEPGKFFSENSGERIKDYPADFENYLNGNIGAQFNIRAGDVKYDGKNLFSGSTKINLADYGTGYSIKSLDGGGFSITYNGKTTAFNGEDLELKNVDGKISISNAEGKTIIVNGIKTKIFGNVEFEGNAIIVHKDSWYERIVGNDFIRVTAKSDTVVVDGKDIAISYNLIKDKALWSVYVTKASSAEWIIDSGNIVGSDEKDILKIARLRNEKGTLNLRYHVDNALVPKENVDFGMDVYVDGRLVMGITPEKISREQLFSAIHDVNGKIVLKIAPENGVLKVKDKDGNLYYTIKSNSDGTYSYVTPDGRKSKPYTYEEISDIMGRNFGSDGITAFGESIGLMSIVGENREKAISTQLPKSEGPFFRSEEELKNHFKAPITSRYGYRKHPVFGVKKYHYGYDLALPYGANVKASDDGVVVFAGWKGGYGNAVVLKHADGTQSLYGHLSSINVRNGQQVSERDVVGKVGSTGDSTGAHLHYEVRDRNGRAINPIK